MIDIKELKNYIYENNYVIQILEDIGCHHIKFHSNYWSCANKTGDNVNAITVYNNCNLSCVNYTRKMIKGNRGTDLIDLICYTLGLDFKNALQFLCKEMNISYYHDFDVELPKSFQVLKQIESLKEGYIEDDEDKPLTPISSKILTYYKPYVNDLFYEDNISYSTQREFNVGYDDSTNYITIPIFSEIGDLVGVKGRLLKKDIEETDLKYYYIEPCNKNKILYGLNKTFPYIQSSQKVFVFEAEKSVMQCWDMGYFNTVSTLGKTMTKHQIEMLVRLNVPIILCFDEDVSLEEIKNILKKFPIGIQLYYMYDKDKILDKKESPSDTPKKWIYLLKHNIYSI